MTGELVVWLGLGGGTVAMLPVLATAVALLLVLPKLARLNSKEHAESLEEGEDERGAMTLLGVVIALRSVPRVRSLSRARSQCSRSS